MATAVGKNRCVTCGKDKSTLRCGGCLQEFCHNDFGHRRKELNKQLDEVEVIRDLFRQTLTEQTTDPQKHPLIQQINDWECQSIKKIRQTAEEARQTLVEHTTGYIGQVEIDLNKLTEQLRQSRDENDFYETDLRHWNEELTRLAKAFSAIPAGLKCETRHNY
jgi:chromosome segregation ATPase